MDNKVNNKIFDAIKDIFINRFNIDISSFKSEDYNKPLLGSPYNLFARDLIYVFFDIEKKFNVTIPQSIIVERRFNSIDDIIKIVNKQINLKTPTSENT